MAFRQKDPDAPSPRGLRDELGALMSESLHHLRTRGELLGIETREAVGVWRRQLLMSAFGFGTAFIAYLLIVGALIGLLGALFSGDGISLANWTGAALLLGAFHFAAAFLILRMARRIGREAVIFEYTLEELRKDQQWLSPEKKN